MESAFFFHLYVGSRAWVARAFPAGPSAHPVLEVLRILSACLPHCADFLKILKPYISVFVWLGVDGGQKRSLIS